MPILFWHVKYKENMKKNDHRSNVGALKISKTTQSNGVKFQHNKILISVTRREMPSEIPRFQKRMLSAAILSNSL